MTRQTASVVIEGVSKDYQLTESRWRPGAAIPGRWGDRVRVPAHRALDDVTLEINTGSTFGFIGANGAGKSTLLKLIAGIMRPTSGSVMVCGRVAALIELGASFHGDLTGRQNVGFAAAIMGMAPAELKRKEAQILHFAGIDSFLDTPVKHYSSGMVARLGFAVAAHVDADVIVLDEVLSVGDAAFQRSCHARVRELTAEGRTAIYVTHALWTVPLLCDRVGLLSRGKLSAVGAPAAMIDLYQRPLDGPAPAKTLTMRIPRTRIGPGEGVRLDIDLMSDETVSRPHILISLRGAEGSLIAGWRVPGVRPLDKGVVTTLSFEITDLQLHPGNYQFHACLTHDAQDTVCDSLTSRPFQVMGAAVNREAFGHYAPRADWSWSVPGSHD